MYCATCFPALTIADLASVRPNLPLGRASEKNAPNDDWGLREREHRLQIQHPGGIDLMGAKAALPSLSLPKQRTHWSVGVVIAGAVLLIILGAAFYTVQVRQREAEEAFAKRQADQTAMIKAEAEKARAEAEKKKAEEDKIKAEQYKIKAEQDKKIAAEEKAKKAEEDKAKAADEKAKAAEEKVKKAEEEKKAKAEEKARKAEEKQPKGAEPKAKADDETPAPAPAPAAAP